MIQSAKPLFPFLLATFLASAPSSAPAEQPVKEEPNKDKVILDKLKTIQETVDAININVELKIQKANTEIADLKSQVSKLTADMEALRKAVGVPPVAATKDMDELRQQLDRLEASLKTVREQLATTRVALSPPVAPEGRIVLKNEYPQAMQVVVNQTTYTVRPGEERELKLPAGPFTFRVPAVPGYQTLQSRKLGTETPHVITIVPGQ